jgi:hypothetical protein
MISAFSTGYQQIYIISLFPLWGSSIQTMLKKFENGQNIRPTHVAEQYWFEACRMNFVTIVLGQWLRTNLRPSMDKGLLNRMVQFTAANSNFLRI